MLHTKNLFLRCIRISIYPSLYTPEAPDTFRSLPESFLLYRILPLSQSSSSLPEDGSPTPSVSHISPVEYKGQQSPNASSSLRSSAPSVSAASSEHALAVTRNVPLLSLHKAQASDWSVHPVSPPIHWSLPCFPRSRTLLPYGNRFPPAAFIEVRCNVVFKHRLHLIRRPRIRIAALPRSLSSRISPGAVPFRLSITIAPSGTNACFQLFSVTFLLLIFSK